MNAVGDSVYAAPGAQAAWRRVRTALGGHSFGDTGGICDSLNAIADREDPIVKVDTAAPRPDSIR